jgi:hypothetical protein
MADRAVVRAIDRIVEASPGTGDGFAFVHPEPDYTDDLGRVQITRFYNGNDVPLTHAVDDDGAVRNNYHLYLSTSALALVELARELNPGDEGMDGIWYLEVGKDRLSRSFSYSETPNSFPSYEMLRDMLYLAPVFGELNGGETVTLASFAGSNRPPASDDIDLVAEIVSLLEKLGAIISESTEKLGMTLKVKPELWDPKKRSDKVREVIEDAASLLRSVAGEFKRGIAVVVDLALDAFEVTVSALEELFESGAGAVVDFLSEQLGSLADPAVAAKELTQLVLSVIRLVRDKITALREFGNDVADWFDRTFGSLKESVDVLIGYFAGVWNGLVDAILGILDTVNMVVSIILGLFKFGAVAAEAWDLALEIIDEILTGLESTDWTDIWTEFTESIYPEIRDTLLEQGRDLADAIDKAFTSNNAAVGYYFGYLVYMIVENFFPPIKLTKVARAASRSAEATSAFLKRLGRFSRGTFPDVIDA